MDVYTLTHAAVMTALGVTVLLLVSGTVLAVSWLATEAVSHAWAALRPDRDEEEADSPVLAPDPDCPDPGCLLCKLGAAAEPVCPTCHRDFEGCVCGVSPRLPHQTRHEEE
jgi:hypothetical protein